MSKISGLFAAMKISATGLAAQRRKMNAIAENIANSSTTRTVEGGPYRRKIMRFFELTKNASFKSVLSDRKNTIELSISNKRHLRDNSGIEVTTSQKFSGVGTQIDVDNASPVVVYDPVHPDADENGYVKLPNIQIVIEMVDMITATRAYEANITAIKAAKAMAMKALEI